MEDIEHLVDHVAVAAQIVGGAGIERDGAQVVGDPPREVVARLP